MKKVLALLLVFVLLCGVTACSGTKEPAEDPTTTTTTPTTTAPSIQKDVNLLTGEAVTDGASNRPIAVMVPNDSKTIGNQAGIDKADLIMETETEGSIPRMMAVFRNVESLPEKIGPVRSARVPHISVARALGAVYIHYGGSLPARNILSTGVPTHLDGMYDSKNFWRDEQLKAAIDYVHSAAISQKGVMNRHEKGDFSTDAIKPSLFKFSDAVKTGETTAKTVQLRTTASHTVTFLYDEATGTYSKNIGKIDSCKPHKTIDGQQLTFANVVVLYAEKYSEATDNGKTTCNFKEGTGNGYIISAGTSREITFNRTLDTLSIMEKDGSDALLNKGKTYLFIVDKTLAGNEIFQ